MKKKYTIEIVPDENPISPRDWDNLGKMVCFHSRYSLGDEHNYSREDAEKLLKEKNIISLLLYLYDHSGITISCEGRKYPYNDRFDSSCVGFIYTTKERILKEKGKKNLTQKLINDAIEIMKSEVATYDIYLRNDVVGYKVKDEIGNVIDSCWGFYSEEEARHEAESVLAYQVKQDTKKKN